MVADAIPEEEVAFEEIPIKPATAPTSQQHDHDADDVTPVIPVPAAVSLKAEGSRRSLRGEEEEEEEEEVQEVQEEREEEERAMRKKSQRASLISQGSRGKLEQRASLASHESKGRLHRPPTVTSPPSLPTYDDVVAGKRKNRQPSDDQQGGGHLGLTKSHSMNTMRSKEMSIEGLSNLANIDGDNTPPREGICEQGVRRRQEFPGPYVHVRGGGPSSNLE